MSASAAGSDLCSGPRELCVPAPCCCLLSGAGGSVTDFAAGAVGSSSAWKQKWLGACWLGSAQISSLHLYFSYLSARVLSDRRRTSFMRRLVQFRITSPKPWRVSASAREEGVCGSAQLHWPGCAVLHRAGEKASPILQPVEPFTQSPSVNSICNIN